MTSPRKRVDATATDENIASEGCLGSNKDLILVCERPWGNRSFEAVKDWWLLTFGAFMSKARLGSENVVERIVLAGPSPLTDLCIKHPISGYNHEGGKAQIAL